MNNKIKGRGGEARAAKFLKKKKYKILETNFTAPGGEIDIIALDKNIIVFAEVKTRYSDEFGLPREAVTKEKQRHIARTALAYLQMNKLTGTPVRFDVIEVTDGGVTHIENAFEV